MENLLAQQQEILARQQAEGATAYDIQKTKANIAQLQSKLAAQQQKLQTTEQTPTLQELATKTRTELATQAENNRKNVLDIAEESDRISVDDNASTSPESAGSDVERPKCRNEKMVGKQHPVTGVHFESRQVEVNGRQIEVVAPRFKSSYEAYLPDNMLTASNYLQFKECNKQLRDAVENDPELRAQFTEDQLAEIAELNTPTGYIWHHDVEEGVMKLVNKEEHQKTGHTGGRYLWGGGSNST